MKEPKQEVKIMISIRILVNYLLKINNFKNITLYRKIFL
jgi:hypothetical protein